MATILLSIHEVQQVGQAKMEQRNARWQARRRTSRQQHHRQAGGRLWKVAAATGRQCTCLPVTQAAVWTSSFYCGLIPGTFNHQVGGGRCCADSLHNGADEVRMAQISRCMVP